MAPKTRSRRKVKAKKEEVPAASEARSARYAIPAPLPDEEEAVEAEPSPPPCPAWIWDATAKLNLAHPHADARVRQQAARMLQDGGEDALKFVHFFGGALAASVLHDEATLVRVAAANALASLQNLAAPYKDSIAMAAQKDRLPAVRFAATNALGETKAVGRAEVLCNIALHDSDAEVRQKAACVLGSFSENAAPQVEVLAKTLLLDQNAGMRWRAALALGEVGRPAASQGDELMAAALRDESAGVRLASMRALASLGAEATPCVEKIESLLHTGNATERKHCARALGIIGRETVPKPATVETLHEAALRDSNYAVRFRAAEALGSLGDDLTQVASERLASKALGASDGELAAEALGALGEASKPQAERLAELLRNGSPEQQKRSASVLGELRSSSMPHLGALADAVSNQPSPVAVRVAAADAFGTLAAPAVPLLPTPTSATRQAALPLATKLAGSLQSTKDLRVFRATARSLGLLGEAASHVSLADPGRSAALRADVANLQLEHRCSTATRHRAEAVMMMRYHGYKQTHENRWQQRGVRELLPDWADDDVFKPDSTKLDVFRLTARTCLAVNS